MDQILARRQGRYGAVLEQLQLFFDLRHDGGQRAAAVTGFVLDAIPAIRIVAGGDDQAAGSLKLTHEKRNSGGGTGFVGEPDRSSGGADGLRDRHGDSIGSEAVVVADHHALARVLGANHVARDGVGYEARIRESEIFSDDGAPAVGAKFDGCDIGDGVSLKLRGHVKKYTRSRNCAKSRIGGSRGAAFYAGFRGI